MDLMRTLARRFSQFFDDHGGAELIDELERTRP
jgi:hypothetical protein